MTTEISQGKWFSFSNGKMSDQQPRWMGPANGMEISLEGGHFDDIVGWVQQHLEEIQEGCRDYSIGKVTISIGKQRTRVAICNQHTLGYPCGPWAVMDGAIGEAEIAAIREVVRSLRQSREVCRLERC